jgi:serine phosphatase RsbU (regulator of sigma subunit)
MIGPGEALLVFSDGVTETWSPEDEEFAEDRLLEVASANLGQDARGMHDAILRAVDAFAAGRKPSDDRTLIVIKRN